MPFCKIINGKEFAVDLFNCLKMSRKIHRKVIYLFILSVSLFSCNDPDYEVAAPLNEYVQRFVNEGAKRGRIFDLEKRGIILEFGELENDVAGRCYYEYPVRIVIDYSYWLLISAAENSDMLKENLLFHELGHGLLNRDHTNAYLTNGDWKSIMCGGDVKDNRSWNINYRSIRREYYINELFNVNTPSPSWATKSVSIADSSLSVVASNDFSTSIGSLFNVGTNTNYSAYISTGKYNFNNMSSTTYLVNCSPGISCTSDFYMVTKVKYASDDANKQLGLFFGQASSPITYNYFMLNNNNRMFVGNNKTFGWYTELIKPQYIANDFNTIAILKQGNEIYYYINGICVYYDTIDTVIGNNFGFEVPGSSSIAVDDFSIYNNDGMRSAQALRKAGTITQKPQTFSKWRSK